MANPPITIGPFNNVPAPGSPIRSNWPQSISQYVTDYTARKGPTNGSAVAVKLVAGAPTAGYQTGTTDGAGDVTVAFSGAGELSGVPGFMAQACDPALGYTCVVHTQSATGCKIRFRTTAGAPVASTAVAFTWIMIGARV